MQTVMIRDGWGLLCVIFITLNCKNYTMLNKKTGWSMNGPWVRSLELCQLSVGDIQAYA